MNILRINELLKENEMIKTKVGEIKRKLNLKGYNQQQKEELKKIIAELKDVYLKNQEECCVLSKMKAGQFANLVCKVLNREHGCSYKVVSATLNYPPNSTYAKMAKHYRNESHGVFLIVTNNKTKSNDVVSTENICQIPIAYMSGYITTNYVDEYTDFLLEQQDICLFASPNMNKIFEHNNAIKTFNLGEAAKIDKTNIAMKKLKESIKKELGILSNIELKSQIIEKQQ